MCDMKIIRISTAYPLSIYVLAGMVQYVMKRREHCNVNYGMHHAVSCTGYTVATVYSSSYCTVQYSHTTVVQYSYTVVVVEYNSHVAASH